MAKLPKEFEELHTPTNKLKRYAKLAFKWLKFLLFAFMIVITFGISEKLSNLILNTDIHTLKQIINVVLVIIVVGLYFHKKEK